MSYPISIPFASICHRSNHLNIDVIEVRTTMHKGISGCSGLDVKKKNDKRWTVLLLLRIGSSTGPWGWKSTVLSAVFTASALIQMVAVSQATWWKEQRVLKSLLSQVGEHQSSAESQNPTDQTDNQSTSNQLHQSAWRSNPLGAATASCHMEREWSFETCDVNPARFQDWCPIVPK